jgi:CheY-like chemotaxis protein
MATWGENIYSSVRAAIERRVLVADDDPDNLELVATMLRQDGFLVKETASGEDLWDLVNDGTPAHLVITDLQMSGISGMDVLSRMQTLHLRIPVILMTGFAAAQLRAQAIRKGAVAVLAKPFSAGALRAVVAEHVSKV